MKKLTVTLLIAILSNVFAISAYSLEFDRCASLVYNDTDDTKCFTNIASDRSFSGDGSIYVIIHHQLSDVGKVYTEKDFPELDIESIEDMTD